MVIFNLYFSKKNVPLLALALMVFEAQAAVYKCESPEGAVTYQSSSCPFTAEESEIVITKQPKGSNSGWSASDEINKALAITSLSNAIAEGYVTVGMTETEVLSAWGSPTRRDQDQTLTAGGTIETEIWEWDTKKKEIETVKDCRYVSRSSVPKKIRRNVPKGVSGGTMCNSRKKEYTITETKYVTFMEGLVTYVHR